MNLLHEISPGKNIPEEVNVIVEINKGSKNKYEIDKETGLIALDRVMKTGQDYPFDYGFVPQSHWHDGDPLDVVLMTTYPIAPGVLVKARPVAVMHMTDDGDADDKIIAVPIEDPRWDTTNDLEDINPHFLKETQHFFETYKLLQKKIVSVAGFDVKEKAKKMIEEGLRLYKEEYKK